MQSESRSKSKELYQVSTDQRERLAMSVERLDQSSDKIRERDLGQTFDSNITLPHYEKSPKKGQAVLFVGDLSYADNHPNHDNNRWDSWGRFSERSTAYQPWIWTTGNHELDFAPEIVKLLAPSMEKINRLSHSRIGTVLLTELQAAQNHSCKYTPQYSWLEEEFPKVNRTETPWLIVLNHSPWYNSYDYHYMKGETMRVMYEPWFVKNIVDVVFSGHVHSVVRSERISNIAYTVVNGICSPVKDQSAPVYITIGDGGKY
ncbi:unnamed protein product [Brassica oleracea]